MAVDHLGADGHGITDDQRRGVEVLGRVGWTAKGVVYVLLAVVAVQLAVEGISGGSTGGTGGEEPSRTGALRTLAEQPFGTVLLGALVVGLAAYAAYRLVSVFLPTTGDDAEDRVKHLGRLASAASYGVLAVAGVRILTGDPQAGQGAGSGDAAQTWTARLLDATWGTVLVLAVAVGIAAWAAFQVHRGVTKGFMDRLECADAPISRDKVELAGAAGHVARGAVGGLVALFLLAAVLGHDPTQVKGFDQVLQDLVDWPGGPYLLLAVAVGLALYGVYCFVAATCREHVEG